MDVVAWIMACITNGNFVVIINGIPKNSFKGSRGLRQGCPLSPLLFLLVIEGLSILIISTKLKKLIHGIIFWHSLSISHILFVDNVIIFGKIFINEWHYFHLIISLFYSASSMSVSVEKHFFFIVLKWKVTTNKESMIYINVLELL